MEYQTIEDHSIGNRLRMEYQWSECHSIGIRLCVLDNPLNLEVNLCSICRDLDGFRFRVKLISLFFSIQAKHDFFINKRYLCCERFLYLWCCPYRVCVKLNTDLLEISTTLR